MKRFASLGATLLVLVGLSTLAFGQGALKFKAEMTGAEEVPTPVSTSATGEATFVVNPEQTAIAFEFEFRDAANNMLGAAGAHLHCGRRGENGPVIAFMAGVIPGNPGGFNGSFETKAVLTAANITNNACGSTIAAIVQAMIDGRVYANAHSTAFPAGEIRGQVESD